MTCGEQRPEARREYLPDERQAVVQKFSVEGHDGYFVVGLYPDGRPGELFIHTAKLGSTVAGFADAWAMAISLLLQSGVPVSKITSMFRGIRFEPFGKTTDAEIPMCASIIDLAVRWMEMRFVK